MPSAPQHEALAERHGTGMLRRFGWFYRVLAFGSRFSAVRFDESSVDRIRAASRRGSVVYVLAHASAADHLALNAVLNRRKLPLSVWSNGFDSFYWQPVAQAWRDLWRRLTEEREDPIGSGWLAHTVCSGNVVTLFLASRLSVLRRLAKQPWTDPFSAVIQAQRSCDRPIQLVPVVVQWTRAPVASSQVRNFLLGRSEAPAWLGQLRNIWFRSDGALIQAGEPIDLREFIDRVEAERAPMALRRVLRRYLRREAQLMKGPRLLPYAQMQRVVLDNPAMRSFAESEARAQGASVESIRSAMEKEYQTIASNFRWWVIRASDVVLRTIWTRVFSGVDVRTEDIERFRAAMRGGSAVLLPCHKSHFDYILISWVFYEHDLIVPHVIAGANLNIWPISVFLRSVGGLFIKRSFAGERLHPTVFSRYLRELIFRGYPVEFYIEGGRSRSGKLLPPRVGVLGMVFDAAEHRPTDHEVTLLPISLAYEEVAEERAYVREAGGEEKQAETVGQLVKARSVLSRRFGRVYLRVGEPIPTSDWVDPKPEQAPWSERGPDIRRAQLHRVGEQVVHRIAEVTVVLPTCLCAAALLAHHRRGVLQDVLFERVRRFRGFLARRGAMEAASLQFFDQAIRIALDRLARSKHIAALEHDGRRIWSIDPGSRIGLEFYKNQLLQFFASAGYVAMAIRALPDAPQSRPDLLPGLEFLVGLWVREFRFDPDLGVGQLLDQGLLALEEHGAVAEEEGRWRVVDPERMGEVHALFRNFAEAYLLILRSVGELDGHDKISLPKHLAKRSEELLAGGVVTRPESLSTITLGNAVSSFLASGVFTSTDGLLGGDRGRIDDAIARLAPMVE